METVQDYQIMLSDYDKTKGAELNFLLHLFTLSVATLFGGPHFHQNFAT